MKFTIIYGGKFIAGSVAAVAITVLFSGSPVGAQVGAQVEAQVKGQEPPRVTSSKKPTSSSDPQCVSLNTIELTEILNDQEILLTLRDESRLKLSLAGSCPQLEYQGRFSYGATAGRLCAGLDRIITRSGDACLIEGFEPIETPE